MREKVRKKFVKFLWVLLLSIPVLSLPLPVRAEEEGRATSYDRTFGYTGGIQQYTVPAAGYYKLEVWGASGGPGKIISGTGHTASGGYGGYSCGYVYLNANTTLYIVVGGAGTTTYDIPLVDDGDGGWEKGTATNVGGYNGGGNGASWNAGWDCASGSGGGATHIATKSGVLSSFASHKSDVLIVAGGGGGAIAATGEGFEKTYNGGSGGGGTGGLPDAVYLDNAGYDKSAAGQSSGYQFGAGQSKEAGGGGGWYGGYYGAGGSGYTGGCLSSLKYKGSTYTSSTSASSHTGHGSAAVTYLGDVLYHQTVQVCYENSDGTFTEYTNVIDQDYEGNSTVTWSLDADSTYQAASVSYTVTADHTEQVTVYRQVYHQKVQVCYENADGTLTEYETALEQDCRAESDVTWTREEDSIYQAASVDYIVNEDKEVQITVYRQKYEVVLNKGVGIASVSGAGSYRAEQEVTINAEVIEGYEFSGWSGSGSMAEQKSTFAMPTDNLSYTASAVESVRPDDNTNHPEDDGDGGDDDKDEGYISSVPIPQKPPVVTVRPSGEDSGDSEDEEDETEDILILPEIVPLPVPTPVPTPELLPEVIERVEVSNEAIGTSAHQWGYTIKKITATAGAGSASGGMIFFIFFWFFRKCKIYDGQNDKLIGKALIRKGKKGMFMVKIPEAVCERAGTKIYLVFSKNFVKANPDKPLKIVAHGKEFYRGIEGKIDLKL